MGKFTIHVPFSIAMLNYQRVNGLMTSDDIWWPSSNMGISATFWRNTARTKSQHQRPFPVKGGTRCKEAGKPRMESTQLTIQCTGSMPGKCHTKNSSWQTTSRGRPLPSEKPMAYRNSNTVRAASKMTDLRRLYSNKRKHKGKQESFGKQAQASINCKQIKSRKNLSQSAGT